MSKAELLLQLETLSYDELAEVRKRVDELCDVDIDDEISAEDLAMVRERVAEYRRNPSDAEDVEVVVARIMSEFKK